MLPRLTTTTTGEERGQSASASLPGTGVLLIGTVATLRALSTQIQDSMPGVVPAGCLLVEGGVGSYGGSITALPPVLGGPDALIDLHSRYRFKVVLLSLPSDQEAISDRIQTMLKRLGVECRVVPTLTDMLSARPAARAASRTNEIDPSVLIGRTHYGLDRKAVSSIIQGKRVLITGAGGSIGSELARVCAGFNPESVILMERAENSLFNIDLQMGRRFPGVTRHAVLHDVVDVEQTTRLMERHRPHVVFHAAAHKHVPLMEDHPGHAVNNNLFGTKSIADASVACGVERFVMISSDKAVNPTSVMGATKRLAEMYVSSLARRLSGPVSPGTRREGRTLLSMVRFGNVLASACSVIPIWTEQIQTGSPITITDPRMTRYFMTIPEAATLVAQAAALSMDPGAAPVYVLDMGESVRIFDLAIRLVRLHGYAPKVTRGKLHAGIEIPDTTDDQADANAPTAEVMFTGSRPGEKLFEQLAYAAEQLRPTAHPGINCWAGSGEAGARPIDIERLIADLSTVRLGTADRAATLALIRRWVPEMSGAAAEAA